MSRPVRRIPVSPCRPASPPVVGVGSVRGHGRGSLRAVALGGLSVALAGCWDLSRAPLPEERYPWQPDSGVPEGWSVERVGSGVRCPAGAQAPLFVVAPDAVDPRVVEDAPRLPVAVIFTSGAFDYLLDPPTGDPLSGDSWRQTLDEPKRLGIGWAADRAFEALGLLTNSDPIEAHTGALAGALAARGIASVVVPNCWGDLWHNRAGVVDNLFISDGFLRDGRTLAEFSWRFLTSPFPPGNPVTLPVKAQRERLYMIGLGEGSRAVAELLRLRDADGSAPYQPAAVVIDSPEDDLSPYYRASGDGDALAIRTGIDRIHLGGQTEIGSGSLATLSDADLPPRLGVILPSGDTSILDGTNDALRTRLDDLVLGGLDTDVSDTDAPPPEVWTWTPAAPAHVLSNSDPAIAKAVADFLAEGLDAVDPTYVDR